MIVSEADAASLPSYNTYRAGEAVLRPIVDKLGGYTVHNAEALRPLDGRSYILAGNHQSNWDPIVMGLALLDLPTLTPGEQPMEPRAIRYMGKDNLWRYPGIRQFITRCGAFAVKRGRGTGLEDHQVDHIAELIESGAVLGIYPQGHRFRKPEDEAEIRREDLKTTVAFLALEYDVPIVPLGIAGPLKGRKLPRTMVFGNPIAVDHGDRIDALTGGQEEFDRQKYDLMDRLHERMNGVYRQARELHAQAQA